MRGMETVFRMLWLIVLAAVVYGSAIRLLRPELSGDTGRGRMERKTAWILGKLALINTVIILAISGMDSGLPGENSLLIKGAEELLCSLLAGGLLAAACMDAKSSYVYNYVWWWCLLWTGMLLALPAAVLGGCEWKITDRLSIRQAAAVVLFVFLQQILFAKMYGRADCHAFSVCALAGCIWRWDLLWFLIHMLLSVTLLAVVQLGRRNVTWNGRLRIPKPFIPYIVTAFWAELLITLYLQGGATHIYA